MRLLLSALVLSLFPLSTAPAAIVITEVMSNSGVTGDWFELTNTGTSAIDIGGYYWDDNGPNGNDGAIFNSFIINAGQSIIVSQSTKAEFATEWGSGFTVLDQTDVTGPDTFSGLSSNGDQIELWDADPNFGPANLIASVTFGVSTLGVSFEWDLDGQSLGLSVAGENGAYTSASGNVGSPGIAGITAVPEPGSFAVLGLGALGMMARRRRMRSKTV